MSMDIIFECDQQKFCSKVVIPKTFLHKAVAARDGLEKNTLLKKMAEDRVHSMIEDFSRITGITTDVSTDVFALCEDIISQMRDVDNDVNFDIEPGFNEAVVPRVPLRMLEHLQNERERRLNSQNKSTAMRALRYDIVDPRTITIKGFEKKSMMEKWSGILKGEIKYEKPYILEEVDVGQSLNYHAVELNQQFLEMPPDTLRSSCLPWGKDDVLISVSIYLGYCRTLNYREVRLGRLMKVSDKIIVRGSQTLLDLKNSFHCTQDYLCLEDVSHRNPTPDDLSLNRFPSSYFFIHDTFYVDESRTGAADTSQCLRQWAHGRHNIQEMHVSKMGTRLIDLKFRFGQPYLYQHQGICEHLIVFTEMHLRDFTDQVGPYPLHILERVFRRIGCIGCKSEGAKWVVLDAELLPTTPAYLCCDCYQELLFFEDGTKKCPFMAVPYFDRKAMDDYGVFLEELSKNVFPVKKEESRDTEGYGVNPSQNNHQEHYCPVEDDMSDYDGSDYEKMSSPRSSEKNR